MSANLFNEFTPSGAKPGGYEVDKDTGLTERETSFVREYVTSGGKKQESAKAAGYSEVGAHSRAYELMRKPRVIKAIADVRRQAYQHFATKGQKVLDDLMMDEHTADSVKMNIALAFLDRAGDKQPETLTIIDKRSPKEIKDKLALLLGTDDIEEIEVIAH